MFTLSIVSRLLANIIHYFRFIVTKYGKIYRAGLVFFFFFFINNVSNDVIDSDEQLKKCLKI